MGHHPDGAIMLAPAGSWCTPRGEDHWGPGGKSRVGAGWLPVSGRITCLVELSVPSTVPIVELVTHIQPVCDIANTRVEHKYLDQRRTRVYIDHNSPFECLCLIIFDCLKISLLLSLPAHRDMYTQNPPPAPRPHPPKLGSLCWGWVC